MLVVLSVPYNCTTSPTRRLSDCHKLRQVAAGNGLTHDGNHTFEPIPDSIRSDVSPSAGAFLPCIDFSDPVRWAMLFDWPCGNQTNPPFCERCLSIYHSFHSNRGPPASPSISRFFEKIASAGLTRSDREGNTCTNGHFTYMKSEKKPSFFAAS